MNIVKIDENFVKSKKCLLKDLILKNYQEIQSCDGTCPQYAKTAFIGSCGVGPKNSLYLITYDRIVLAENPLRVWDSPYCPVIVDEFVNIEIIAKAKISKEIKNEN